MCISFLCSLIKQERRPRKASASLMNSSRPLHMCISEAGRWLCKLLELAPGVEDIPHRKVPEPHRLTRNHNP